MDAPGPAATPEGLARAREELFIAEGSDWFWWYGDDHSSDHDLEFDDLFRRHLRKARPELTERDVLGPFDVPGVPLILLAYVE